MPYKKIAVILSVISLILVLTFFIVSCCPKTSSAQNTAQESETGSAAATEEAVAASQTSPSSLSSQTEPESQSSSLPTRTLPVLITTLALRCQS